MLVVGVRVLPWILDQVARTGSRELFTLAVVAIALGVGYGSAELFGVSFALGAFFAGMCSMARTTAIAPPSTPSRCRMPLPCCSSSPSACCSTRRSSLTEPLHVLGVLAVIVVGKPVMAYAIMRLLGQPAVLPRHVAAGLGQIGEFSFILVALGVELKLLPEKGQDLVLAGALLAITLNPFLHRLLLWERP